MQRDAPAADSADSRVRLLRRRADTGALWIDGDGLSMRAAVRTGDRLLVETSTRAPKIGEVWLHADRAGELIAHRCIARRDGTFIFRGDAERRSDPPVTPAQLVGRISVIERGSRRHRVNRAPVLKTYLQILLQRFRKIITS